MMKTIMKKTVIVFMSYAAGSFLSTAHEPVTVNGYRWLLWLPICHAQYQLHKEPFPINTHTVLTTHTVTHLPISPWSFRSNSAYLSVEINRQHSQTMQLPQTLKSKTLSMTANTATHVCLLARCLLYYLLTPHVQTFQHLYIFVKRLFSIFIKLFFLRLLPTIQAESDPHTHATAFNIWQRQNLEVKHMTAAVPRQTTERRSGKLCTCAY